MSVTPIKPIKVRSGKHPSSNKTYKGKTVKGGHKVMDMGLRKTKMN